MRKIGTISAAAGLIYLGSWMIINKINPELGAEVFKWWPMVIILLGVEVIVHFARKGEERVGFNFLIIPVLILMLVVNLFNGVKTNFNGWFGNWNVSGVPRINISGLNFNDWKKVNTSKSLPVHGNVLYIHTNNASLDVKASNDGEIRIEGKIFVDEDSFVNKYDIVEKREQNGYTIDIMENFIKGVELDVYIPDGYDVKIGVDNLDLSSNDEFEKTDFDIEADNINVKLNGAQSAVMNYRNANINFDDVRDVNLKGDNGNINVRGNSENINIKARNGKVDVNNEICKNVNVELNNGVVSVRTDDENVSVRIELDDGISGINNEKGINKGMSKTFGTGAGNVQIKVEKGTANFRN